MSDGRKHSAVTLGATYFGRGKCRFEVWAPAAERVDVHIVAPNDRVVPLVRAPRGYHTAVVETVVVAEPEETVEIDPAPTPA